MGEAYNWVVSICLNIFAGLNHWKTPEKDSLFSGGEQDQTKPNRTDTMADAKPGAMSETSTTVAVTNATDPKNIQDLTVFVQTLLQQMQERFQGMSDQIIARIDDMGTRIDDLEKNISELMTQAGMDEPEKWRDEGMIWTRLFDDILPAELDFLLFFSSFLKKASSKRFTSSVWISTFCVSTLVLSPFFHTTH